MERYSAVLKENIRFNLPLPLLLSILLLCISPLFLGLENLGETDSYKVLEYYVILLGYLLFPPVFLAEQNKDIRDLISSKYMPVGVVYALRIVTALVCSMVLTGIYMAVMKAGACTFAFLPAYAETLSGIVFAGGMGVFAYAAADHIVIGYMVPVVYYIFCLGAGYEKLGVFYLFSMSVGKGEDKLVLLGAGIVFLILGVLLRVRRE